MERHIARTTDEKTIKCGVWYGQLRCTTMKRGHSWLQIRRE